MNHFEETTRNLCAFIQESPTSYHAIDQASGMLEQKGFAPLSEGMRWNLSPGGSYYVSRGGSSLIAFGLPAQDPTHFQLVASHSDSPLFKIKENPELVKAGHYVELNVEKYGDMLLSPWLDRPLGIAGRILVRREDGIHSVLVHPHRDLALIPSLAIHMDRTANERVSHSIQSDLLPVLGDETQEGFLREMLAQEADVLPEQILAEDLFLYNRTEPSFWGAGKEFFSSPRLDNLQCAYASLLAITGAFASPDKNEVSSHINVCCIFDHEEVGSRTRQGAGSSFLSDVLERIALNLGKSREDFLRMLAGSFLLSADNSHAVHPNHTEKADPVNRPVMNGGVVLKFNASQKYTTDAVSAAVFREICAREKIPTQNYVNHSDIPGGSTLGNISTAHVSIDAADIGCAQLSMHSPYETAGIKDTWYMAKAMQAFYQTEIHKDSSGIICTN